LHRFADEKGVTPAQVSLAWMLAKWPFVTPIPGSRRIERIDELARIEGELAKVSIHGNRTDANNGHEPRASESTPSAPARSIRRW
jgi:diketogulonate reductase-like aldo/keto reductase